MIDLTIHDWKDALAAVFFVVVLPAFFILALASAFMEDFKRQGNWQTIKADIWKFNDDIIQESLYGIGFGGIFLGALIAAKYGWSYIVGIFVGVFVAFVIAGVLTFTGRVFQTILVFFLARKHPLSPTGFPSDLDEKIALLIRLLRENGREAQAAHLENAPLAAATGTEFQLLRAQAVAEVSRTPGLPRPIKALSCATSLQHEAYLDLLLKNQSDAAQNIRRHDKRRR